MLNPSRYRLNRTLVLDLLWYKHIVSNLLLHTNSLETYLVYLTAPIESGSATSLWHPKKILKVFHCTSLTMKDYIQHNLSQPPHPASCTRYYSQHKLSQPPIPTTCTKYYIHKSIHCHCTLWNSQNRWPFRSLLSSFVFMLRVEFNDIYFYHQNINLLHQFMLLFDSLCLFYQKTSFRANSLTLLNFIFLSVPSFIVPPVMKHNVNCIVTKQRIFFIFFKYLRHFHVSGNGSKT